MRKNIFRTTISLAALSLVLTACGGNTEDEADVNNGEGGTTDLSIAMATTGCMNFFPLYVAQEEGYFEDEGLNVRIEKVNGSASVLQAMMAGQVDLGSPGAAPVILAAADGNDIDFIGNLKPGGSFALVAHGDTGIEGADDLVGKTIGVATADGNEVNFTNAVLEAEGVNPDDVEILVVGEGGQAVAGFERGDIDAYAGSMDGIATLTLAGVPLTNITGDEVGYFFGNGLASTAEYAADNGDAIEAFGRAYLRGQEAGFSDTSLVIDACGEHQPQEVEDEEYVEAMMEAVAISMEVPEGRQFGEQVEADWQQLIDGMVASGDLEEGQISPEDVYTNDFIDGFNE